MANKKYSVEFIDAVIKECKATGTKKPIAEKYGIPLTTLCHWINNAEATIVGNVKYSDKTRDKVIKEYSEGATVVELVKKYSIVEGTINSWVKPIARKRGVNNKVEHEDYFDVIDTERKAYYLGWLMADGNVSTHNNQYSLKIHIQLKDRELIDNFVKDIGCTNSIIEKNNFFRPTGKYHQSCYVSITSVHMVKALMENGVVPNKTKAECIPNIPEHLIQHFIRGFFDGDGIVSCTDKSHSAGFVSNNEMLEQIENYVQLGNKIAPHWKTEGIGTILTNSVKKIAKLYDYLYKDATIYLQRKHDALKAITNGNTEVTN